MAEKEFYVVEEDGVVIYDESDDYDPDEPVETEGGFHLPDNEEIFTDEYMQEFARKMDAKIAEEEKRQERNKRIDKYITIAMVTGLTIFFAIVIYSNL